MANRRRERQLKVYLYDTELTQLRHKAWAADLTVSEYIRRVIDVSVARPMPMFDDELGREILKGISDVGVFVSNIDFSLRLNQKLADENVKDLIDNYKKLLGLFNRMARDFDIRAAVKKNGNNSHTSDIE